MQRGKEMILDWMSRLEQICFSDAWSRKSLADTARHEYNVICIVHRDVDRPCGFMHDYMETEEEPCGYLIANLVAGESELLRIAVSPDCRGRGYGDALMRFYHAQTVRLCRRYLLEVRESNAAARHLYERFGYRAIGVRRRYYSAPEEDGILYEYSVPVEQWDCAGGKVIPEWKR